jgi:hypothetical protein
MSLKSRQEIDFKRLLKKCESMAEKDINENNWRLEKVLFLINFLNLFNLFNYYLIIYLSIVCRITR